MHSKSIDWFLCDCNMRLIWVKIDKIPMKIALIGSIKPFLANVPNLYLLKLRENIWFPRGYRMKVLARNGLKNLPQNL